MGKTFQWLFKKKDARKPSQFDSTLGTKNEEDDLNKKGKMCEKELTLEEEKDKEKENEAIFKMESAT